MKITLVDKKVVSSFMESKSCIGKSLRTDGKELRGTWGSMPLIAKWTESGMIYGSPEDKYVRQVQEMMGR